MRGRVLGGVAGGLADRHGVSELGPRIVFGAAGVVVASMILRALTGFPPGMSSVVYLPGFRFLRTLVTFAAGVLVLAYALLWALVPAEGASPRADRAPRRLPSAPGVRAWLGTLALVAGSAVLGAQIGLWPLEVIWAFLLIGVGVLLFRRDAARANGKEPPEAAVTFPGPASDRLTGAAEPAEPAPPAARPARERSPLGWIALGAAMLVVGGAVAAQNIGAVDLRPVRFPALALLVLGLGMMLGAFVGRARWLLLPALPLVPLVLALSVVTVPLEGGIGDRWVSPRTLEEALGAGEGAEAYRVVMGTVHIDLSALRCASGTVPLEASTGFGSVSLYVPFDAHVLATGSVGYGRIYLQPHERGGTRVELSRRLEPKAGDGATIVANLAAGIGDVSVYREHLTRRQRERACR